MHRAIHPPGEHLATCGGPEDCQEFYEVVCMTKQERLAWVLADNARRAARLRAAAPAPPAPPKPKAPSEFAPPDPYNLAGIAPPVRTPKPFDPPDSYGLNKGK